jgi:hypothetical protein
MALPARVYGGVERLSHGRATEGFCSVAASDGA